MTPAVTEFQFSASIVSGEAPYLIHRAGEFLALLRQLWMARSVPQSLLMMLPR